MCTRKRSQSPLSSSADILVLDNGSQGLSVIFLFIVSHQNSKFRCFTLHNSHIKMILWIKQTEERMYRFDRWVYQFYTYRASRPLVRCETQWDFMEFHRGRFSNHIRNMLLVWGEFPWISAWQWESGNQGYGLKSLQKLSVVNTILDEGVFNSETESFSTW